MPLIRNKSGRVVEVNELRPGDVEVTAESLILEESLKSKNSINILYIEGKQIENFFNE